MVRGPGSDPGHRCLWIEDNTPGWRPLPNQLLAEARAGFLARGLIQRLGRHVDPVGQEIVPDCFEALPTASAFPVSAGFRDG